MLWNALIHAARALGDSACWFYDRRFHFPIGGGWTIALSADSAGRVRVETCHLGVIRDTKWCKDGDAGRLAQIVAEARDEVAAEV